MGKELAGAFGVEGVDGGEGWSVAEEGGEGLGSEGPLA